MSLSVVNQFSCRLLPFYLSIMLRAMLLVGMLILTGPHWRVIDTMDDSLLRSLVL